MAAPRVPDAHRPQCGRLGVLNSQACSCPKIIQPPLHSYAHLPPWGRAASLSFCLS